MRRKKTETGAHMYPAGFWVKFFAVVVAAGFVQFALCAPAQAGPAAKDMDAPVVKVNGTVLTEENLAEVMQKIVPAASFHGGLSQEKLEKYRPGAIVKLVDEELMYQRAEALSMEVDESRVKDTRTATIRRLGGKRQYREALKIHGMSDKQYMQRIRRGFLIEKFVKEQIEAKAVVGDDEVSARYEKNKSMYVRPMARRVRHIFFKVPPASSAEQVEERRKLAESVLEKLHDGEDFSTLAWDHSNGPYKVKGGDMGVVHKGRLEAFMEEEIEKLNEGELSGLVRSIYGFHILKVDEVLPEEQLSFESVQEKIYSTMSKKRLEEVRESVMSSLREKAEIKVWKE